MKRKLGISLIILVLSTVFSLNAQTKKAVQKIKTPISLDSLIFKKLTCHLEVGYNNPTQYKTTLYGDSTTFFNGVKVGLTTDYKINNNFSLLVGALYNLVYSDRLQIYSNAKSVRYVKYAHYINVPVQLIYNLPVSNDFKFFALAGPTLNIGLGQMQSTLSTVATIPSAYTNMYNSSLNRLDLQIGAGGGVQWKRYQLKGGYDFGLLNLDRLSIGGLYQKGWYVSLSVTL